MLLPLSSGFDSAAVAGVVCRNKSGNPSLERPRAEPPEAERAVTTRRQRARCSPGQSWELHRLQMEKDTSRMTFILPQRQRQQLRRRLKQLLPPARSVNGLGHINNRPGREKGQESQTPSVCCLQGYSITARGAKSNGNNSGDDGDGVTERHRLSAPAGPAVHPQDGKCLWKQQGLSGVHGTRWSCQVLLIKNVCQSH